MQQNPKYCNVIKHLKKKKAQLIMKCQAYEEEVRLLVHDISSLSSGNSQLQEQNEKLKADLGLENLVFTPKRERLPITNHPNFRSSDWYTHSTTIKHAECDNSSVSHGTISGHEASDQQDRANSVEDSRNFEKLKSEVYLRKDMPSPLSPLPPTPPSKCSCFPDVFPDRCINSSPAFDDLMSSGPNSPAADEYFHQFSVEQDTSESANNCASEESNKLFKAKLSYDDTTKSFSLRIDAVSSGLITVEAFGSGAAHLTWHDTLQMEHSRSSCAERSQSPEDEDENENGMDCRECLKPECDSGVTNVRNLKHKHFEESKLHSSSEKEKGLKLLEELQNSDTFHEQKKGIPLKDLSIPNTSYSIFQNLSHINNEETFSQSEFQEVNDGKKSVRCEDIASYTLQDDSLSDDSESSFYLLQYTVHEVDETDDKGYVPQDESQGFDVISEDPCVCAPSEEFISLNCPYSEFQNANNATDTEETSTSLKKLLGMNLKSQRLSKNEQSEEHCKSGLKNTNNAVDTEKALPSQKKLLGMNLRSQRLSENEQSEEHCKSGIKNGNNIMDTEEASPSQKKLLGMNLKSRRLSKNEQSEEHCKSGIKNGNNIIDTEEASPSQKKLHGMNLRPRRLSKNEQSEEHCKSGLKLKSQRIGKRSRAEVQDPPIAISKLKRLGNLNYDEQASVHCKKLFKTDVGYPELSKAVPVKESLSLPVIFPRCDEVSGLNDRKLQDLPALHELGRPEPLKSGENALSEVIGEPVESVVPGETVSAHSPNFVHLKAGNQGTTGCGLTSGSTLQKAKQKSRKSDSTMSPEVSCLSSGQKLGQKTSNSKEQASENKKLHGNKSEHLKQSECSLPDKPSCMDFVLRSKKTKSLNISDIMQPVKPKRNTQKQCPRLCDSEIPCKSVISNKNLLPSKDFGQSDLCLNRSQTASSPEQKNTVNELSPSVQPVLIESSTEIIQSNMKRRPKTKSGSLVPMELNNVKQTLSASSEIQVDIHATSGIDVEQSVIQEQKLMSRKRPPNFHKENIVVPSLESKRQTNGAIEVYKSEARHDLAFLECNVNTKKMCNGDQESAVISVEAETFDPADGLNMPSVNANAAGNVNAILVLNVESEEQVPSKLVSKQGKYAFCDVISNENVLIKGNECYCVTPKKKPKLSVKKEDLFITPLERNHFFQLAQGKLKFNAVLHTALQMLEQAYKFSTNPRAVQDMFLSSLLNPMAVPSVQEAVSTIVHFLGSSKLDPFKNIKDVKDINLPVIPLFEERLVDCLFSLPSRCEHLKGFIDAIFSMSHAQIFFNQSLTIYGVASLCRVYTELHKRRNSVLHPCDLVYNMLAHLASHRNVPYLLAAVAGVWPKILDFRNMPQGTQNPVCMAVSRVLFNTSFKTSHLSEKSLKIVKHLSKLSSPQSLPPTSKDLVQKIFDDFIWIDNNGSLDKNQAAHYIKAVALLCTREHWKWTYDVVIAGHIYPFLNKWVRKHKMSRHPINSVAMKAVFRLIGSLCCMIPKEQSATTDSILTTLKTSFVDSSRDVPLVVQEAAVGTLLRLEPLNHELVAPPIQAWMKKHGKEMGNDKSILLEARSHLLKF